MAAYVDRLRDYSAWTARMDGQTRRTSSRNAHLWCHLWADTPEELHALARRIGLKRAWFQDRPGFPHYDLTPGRRALALRAGAVEGVITGPPERGRRPGGKPAALQP